MPAERVNRRNFAAFLYLVAACGCNQHNQWYYLNRYNWNFWS